MRAYRVPGQRDEALRALAELKAGQFGLFERNQARDLGLSDDFIHRELALGRLLRIHPRVFHDPAVSGGWLQDLFAAVLWAGEGCAVSHRSAAALWKLDGFEPGIVEITVPSPRRREGIVLHRGALRPADTTEVAGIPVTAASRTLLDLAGVVEEETLEIGVDCALRRGLTSISYLKRRFADRSGRGCPGSASMRRLLDQRDNNKAAESALETRFLRLLRNARVPLPEPGYKVGSYRLDFAYPHIRLGIELDGYAFHSNRVAWERDLRRQNELLALGWTLLRFTWTDVTQRAEAVIAEIRRHVSPNLLS